MLVNERNADKVHPQFDAAASMQEARKRLSLEQVIEQHGHGPRLGGGWKSFVCPFCNKKGKAGLFKAPDGVRLFKCHSTSCPSGTKAMDEVGFIEAIAGLSRTDAFQSYLKQAGVWRERTTLKSPRAETAPSAAKDHLTPALSPSGEGEEGGGGDEPSAEEMAETFPADDGLSSPGTSDHPDGSPGIISGTAEAGLLSVPAAADASSPAVPPADTGDDVSPTSVLPSNVVLLNAPTSKAATDGAGGGATAGATEGEVVTLKGGELRVEDGGKAVAAADEVVKPVEVVREFYGRLTWSEKDERACWEKRGLESRTSVALGFRSNPKANKAILVDLGLKFEDEIILESGLWVRARDTGKPKPGGKFWGWGRRARAVTFDDEGFPIKAVEDHEYEVNEPVLIPYLAHKPVEGSRGEALHELISLRPHKDMGAKGTTTGHPHLYVPRVVTAAGAKVKREFFRTVVVTEGEFKAAALWQSVGLGRTDGRKPIGVCAMPGISFGKNYDVREELTQFLRMTGAEHVVVVFDNEQKGDPKLAGFKPDWRKRHDAEIWARYLAEDLYGSKELSLKTSRVGRIGTEWRDDKGKADWDGMMATIAKGQ